MKNKLKFYNLYYFIILLANIILPFFINWTNDIIAIISYLLFIIIDIYLIYLLNETN